METLSNLLDGFLLIWPLLFKATVASFTIVTCIFASVWLVCKLFRIDIVKAINDARQERYDADRNVWLELLAKENEETDPAFSTKLRSMQKVIPAK